MLPARNPPEAPLVPNEQNRRFALILRGLVTARPGPVLPYRQCDMPLGPT